MTDEYTPTVEEVRASADWGAFTDPAEFDRMVAAVERAAAVKALREAARMLETRQHDLDYSWQMVHTMADRIEGGESA